MRINADIAVSLKDGCALHWRASIGGRATARSLGNVMDRWKKLRCGIEMDNTLYNTSNCSCSLPNDELVYKHVHCIRHQSPWPCTLHASSSIDANCNICKQTAQGLESPYKARSCKCRTYYDYISCFASDSAIDMYCRTYCKQLVECQCLHQLEVANPPIDAPR